MSQESQVLKELSMLSTNMDLLVRELREQNKKTAENTEQLKTINMWSSINEINHPYNYGTCLIVDDISDSGKTFHFLKKYYLTEVECLTDYAALVVKPKSSFMPDYFAMSVSNDVWVKFPWE